MAEQFTPDICVIGGGAGGLAAAAAAAALGVPVVLVEKARLGGTRLNTGCVPSMALIAAGRRAQAFRTSAPFGIKPVRPSIEFFQVNDHVQQAIAAVAPNDSRERYTALGVRVIEGEARFTDAATVAVGDAFEIKARHFIVATGSVPLLPPIPGLDETPFLTNETIFEARERPKHLVVIGAGSFALPLAQAFHRLGAEVTVLEPGQPLASEDPEAAAIVLNQLAREGVTIRSGVKIVRTRRVRSRIEVVLDTGSGEETIEGSDLLIASGWRPAVEGLGLDAAGIRHDASGIAVDDRLRTSNRNVYAIGDVIGALPSAQAASHHADLVIRQLLLRDSVRLDPKVVPRVTLTDPEIAHVGMAEPDARKRARAIRVLRWPYHENERAQAARETPGHIKVITDAKGKVLGATIVGASASELIAPWALMIGQRLNIRAFAGIVVPHPALTEMGVRAAASFPATRRPRSWVQRMLGWLRRSG